tara:strand:+ start:1389 stop:1802 length:414 start_codon:yes stop_codon:yes gene_type:complete
MSTSNIIYKAMKGQEINKRIKELSKELESIKKDLRAHAQENLTGTESANAVFDFTDPQDQETITAQVRFPPSSIQLSANHIEKVISLIGKEEFDRLFTIRQQVITNTDQLDDLDLNVAGILGDYITLKENTPRVSFK